MYMYGLFGLGCRNCLSRVGSRLARRLPDDSFNVLSHTATATAHSRHATAFDDYSLSHFTPHNINKCWLIG